MLRSPILPVTHFTSFILKKEDEKKMKICERKKLRLPRVRMATTENFPILIRRRNRRASCTIFNVKGIIIIISISHTPSSNFIPALAYIESTKIFTTSHIQNPPRVAHISLSCYGYIHSIDVCTFRKYTICAADTCPAHVRRRC
jgi:hypothetical protein